MKRSIALAAAALVPLLAVATPASAGGHGNGSNPGWSKEQVKEGKEVLREVRRSGDLWRTPALRGEIREELRTLAARPQGFPRLPEVLDVVETCKTDPSVPVTFQVEGGPRVSVRGPSETLVGCVTSNLRGELSVLAVRDRCAKISAEEGGYPILFYGRYDAADEAGCIVTLGALGRGDLAVPAGSTPRPVDEGLE